MYSRTAEVSINPQQREQFLDLVNSELQPLLQRQPGYVDGVGLVSEADPSRGISVVFWKTREDAERFYSSDQFARVRQRLMPYLRSEPTIRTYTVETSTHHGIAAGRAA